MSAGTRGPADAHKCTQARIVERAPAVNLLKMHSIQTSSLPSLLSECLDDWAAARVASREMMSRRVDNTSRYRGGSRHRRNHSGTSPGAGQRRAEDPNQRYDLSPASTTTITHSRLSPQPMHRSSRQSSGARQQLGTKLARQRGEAAAEASWANPILPRHLQASQDGGLHGQARHPGQPQPSHGRQQSPPEATLGPWYCPERDGAIRRSPQPVPPSSTRAAPHATAGPPCGDDHSPAPSGPPGT